MGPGDVRMQEHGQVGGDLFRLLGLYIGLPSIFLCPFILEPVHINDITGSSLKPTRLSDASYTPLKPTKSTASHKIRNHR
jgi:hypothetical protein